MLKVSRFTCENLTAGCVTDEPRPCFAFALESDRQGARLKSAVLSLNGWQTGQARQTGIRYEGPALQPFTAYRAELLVTDDSGETAAASVDFETGRMMTPWTAEWISDPTYAFTKKKVSPVPMQFCKRIQTEKPIASARIYATAMGIYELALNGEKVGEEYFAPGFTSYQSQLQYQTYDVTEMLKRDNLLTVCVGGGWAVGAFVFTRKNRISADRQALLLELRITYADGTAVVIGTDESWQVSEEGHYRAGDFYDGEVYDATVDPEAITWKPAAPERLRINPDITAAYGAPVRAHQRLRPVSCTRHGDCLIYDFGQNFAGVVELRLHAAAGQQIVVRHAEILNPDGSLNTRFLRTAKARLVYFCRDGWQQYSPRLTYMGFRYISVTGIAQEDLEVAALALYSDLEQTGSFHCSNEQINQLQSNILWSARSNFVDIPTDCPQRDERMGWTGDIAVFAATACFNFDMSRFLRKWLRDVAAEQRPGGGIPNTVPVQGYGFPATMPVMAVDFWGDACVLVPWAEYCARGDIEILRQYYPVMKKYVKACKFWAGLLSLGKYRYIWHTPAVLHFGDWVAPDRPKMKQWQQRSRWTATASLCRTSGLLAKIAGILGEKADQERYAELSSQTAAAYAKVFTDGNGRLKNEFQTGYVLPIYFNMLPQREKQLAAQHLVRLIEADQYRIGTGFPGTPYILFALADSGYSEAAYKMLLNTECPSWLYQIRMGATTVWERWDGLDENGCCPISDDGTDQMISYNHYASGAVGDFLYRRIAGIEALEGGYRKFRIAPLPGGGIHSATGSVETPYGKIVSQWELQGGCFTITVRVPIGTDCELGLPDGSSRNVTAGTHIFQTTYKESADV